MSKMSKDKRDKLLLTIIGVVGVVAVLYYLVITDQRNELAELDLKIEAIKGKKENAERTVRRQADFQANLEKQRKVLDEKQAEMPRPGQDPRWFHSIIEARRSRHGLDVGDIRLPQAADPGILPKLPFSGTSFEVALLGTYADFGRFLADFENSYPYMRVQLVNIAPELRVGGSGLTSTAQSAASESEPVKLRFTFRVISLVKTPT